MRFGAVILFFVLVLSACANPQQALFPRQPAATAATSTEQPINASHIGHRTVTACLDVTTSYPRSYFQAAKNTIASAITAAVQPNQDGLTAYVTLINHNSFDPTSTIAAITVPPLSPDPTPPSLMPSPTASSDPFASAKAQGQVDAINAKRQQDYQTALHQSHLNLERIRKQVQKQTDLLRASNPPADSVQTDILGCLERQSQRMRDRGAGENYLFIASDGENNTLDEQTTLDIHNLHIHVRFIWFYCQYAPDCTDTYWRDALKKAGANDVTFSDPSESQSIPNLLS